MQTRSQTVTEKKISIMGDGGVGKTTFVKKVFSNTFDQKYIPTLGMEVYPLKINKKSYTLWDTAGQQKFAGLRENYTINSDYGIIMCSESKITQRSIIGWYEDLKRISPNIKIIVLCNKSELDYELSEKVSVFLTDNEVEVHYISVKNQTKEELTALLKRFEKM